MQLSAGDTELLRSRPHETRLFLSIYQPKTVLACQVNDASIAKGARTIAWDSMSTGTWENVDAGFTALIGTELGAWDKGTIRVRSIATGTMTVAENSDINWADDDFISIIQQVDINAIYPRIIQDPDDEEDVIFYKDYDIVYTDQNEVLGSFVCMGSHRATNIENGVAQIFWSASGTYNVKGDGLAYEWEFEGGSPSYYSGTTPGNVTYTTPGEYLTKLTVTNDSGGTDIGYRYTSIHDNSINPPIRAWTMESMDGSRDSGGYTTKIILHDVIPTLIPNSVVVIYAKDRYGATDISLGGNNHNDPSIVFSGHILDDTVEYNYRDNQTSFSVGTVNELMKMAEGFSLSVESVVSPTSWVELQEMTIPKALYHYLRWQTTVLYTTDFRYTWEDRAVQYFDTERTSLYESISSWLHNSMIGELTSDRLSILWAERSAGAVESAETSITETFNIIKRDWVGTPSIIERTQDDISYYELGGIAYSGANTGTFTPYMTNAPGNAPSYRGSSVRAQGLILLDQDDLNELSGNLFAYGNSTYKQLGLNFIGNYRNLDIAPIERIGMNIEAGDTNNNIIMTGQPFHIKSMVFSYDAKNAFLGTSATLAQLVNGVDGDTIPVIYPPDYNVPPSPPYLPVFDFPLFPFPISSGSGQIPSAPVLTPTEDIIDEDDCATDTSTPPNGGYYLWVTGTQLSNINNSFFIYYPCVLRSSSHTHKSQLYILGTWQTRSALTGAWEDDDADDSWYSVYAIGAGGERVLAATKEAITDPNQRIFTFNPPASIQIQGFQIVIDQDNQEFIVDSATWSHSQGTLLSSNVDFTALASGIKIGSTFTVRLANVADDPRFFFTLPLSTLIGVLDRAYNISWSIDVNSTYIDQLQVRLKNADLGFITDIYDGSDVFTVGLVTNPSLNWEVYTDFGAQPGIPYPIDVSFVISTNVLREAQHRIIYDNAVLYNVCSIPGL